MGNTSAGIYLMLYKSQADKRIPTVDSYLYTSAGIETKDFNLLQPILLAHLTDAACIDFYTERFQHKAHNKSLL